MILQKIELNNFGSYKDYNAFNLNTSDPDKKIVIIGGKNGAGKTTLFVAVELALYGHYCFGYKNSGKRYTKKIISLTAQTEIWTSTALSVRGRGKRVSRKKISKW